ncbi:hypothetical protein [Aridibaculum aurantiacum]|uniref:hypothetical protein n=1 Tax=Aridibaculum aurantiacum TaxID=2810307 RepID=UPI001A973C65|nr:hypothetical protein [Aridibaculum aurantiacum]
MVTLTIKDETAGGKVINETRVSFNNELATVQEIITARVTAEVEQYNNRLPEYYQGLVQPGEAEVTLNGFKMKQRRKVDAEKQVLVALEAFNRNGYFMLIDNIQAESLEQMIVINPKTEISFIKLTPLVGG